MRPFGGEAQKQNHEGLRLKVDNIISMWIGMVHEVSLTSGIKAGFKLNRVSRSQTKWCGEQWPLQVVLHVRRVLEHSERQGNLVLREGSNELSLREQFLDAHPKSCNVPHRLRMGDLLVYKHG